MPHTRAWEWVAIAAFAAFAVYVAAEPIFAAGDCISIGEILVLLPYYALLYFGTIPALIWVAIRRIDLVRRLSFLGVLLFLEVVACFPSDYMGLANRCLDFIPSVVLALWLVRSWLCARAPRDARS